MSEMNEYDTELEHDLQNHYQHLYGNPPIAAQIWERVTPLLGQQEQSTSWWPHLSRMNKRSEIVPGTNAAWQPVRKLSTRLVIALVLLVVVIVFAGTSYAALGPTLFNDLFKMFRLQNLAFTDYHQSQSIDGYTFTIQEAHADANEVIIAYSVEVPPGGILPPFIKFGSGSAKLTTEQGVELRQSAGVSADPTNGISGNIYFFDASSIQNHPQELHLNLAVPYTEKKGQSPLRPSGYLTFHFAVPFDTGHAVNLHQSVTANGKTITLERVVVTSSTVRAYISGFGQRDVFSNGKMLTFTLSIGTHQYGPGGGYMPPGKGWWIDFGSPSPFDAHTQWTLVVQFTKGYPPTPTGDPADPVWTFHFQVP